MLSVALLVGVVGLWLFVGGVWPRRRGATPYCRKCRYNLTGTLGDGDARGSSAGAISGANIDLKAEGHSGGAPRCPECGGALGAEGIIRGERRRRPRRIAMGALLFLMSSTLGLGALVALARGIDWIAQLPTGAVIWIIEHADGRIAKDAAGEIESRFDARQLTDAQLLQLARLMMDVVSRGGVPRAALALSDLLCTALGLGLVPAEEVDRFFTRVVQVRLRARPRVVAGRDVPIVIEHDLPGLSLGVETIGRQMRIGSVVDTKFSHIRWGGDLTRSFSTIAVPPGRTPLSVDITMQVSLRSARVLWTQQRTLETELEVLASEPPDLIRLTHSPELDSAIGLGVRVFAQRRDDDRPGHLTVGLSVHFEASQPIGQAYEVLVEIAGAWQSVGTVHHSGGTRFGKSSALTARFPQRVPERINITLRPSTDAAQETVDAFEIFDGELHFRELPVAAAEKPERLADEPLAVFVSPERPTAVVRRANGGGE